MILNLSGNRIASCCAVCPQFWTGWVHFFRILVNARYTSFSNAVSEVNTPLFWSPCGAGGDNPQQCWLYI